MATGQTQTADAMRGRAREVFWQASHYAASSGLSILASMISYPLLTRLLSQSDYGLMSLVSASLFGLVAFGKLGLSNAAVRFFPEYNGPENNRNFLSSLLWLPILNSTLLALLACAVFLLCFGGASAAIRHVLLLAVPITIFEAAKALLFSFMRAGRQSRRLSAISTLDRYMQMGIGIAFILLFRRNVTGWYAGWLVWDALLIGMLIGEGLRTRQLRIGWLDADILRTALRFSGPLMFMEFGGLGLNYADRYMIAKYMGTSAAGVYSAAYNFTTTVPALLLAPLGAIIFPWASQIWTASGKAETEHFASKVLDGFFAVGIPMAVGVTVLRQPAMAVFASMKYNSAASLLPPLIAAQIAYGVYTVLTLGLFLHKRTVTMALQLILGTVVNIASNVFLIPRIGMMGAAWAMCISNGFLILMAMRSSLPLLQVKVDWPMFSKVIVSSGVMAASICALPFSNHLARLLLGSGLGATVYSVVLLTIDRDLRRLVIGVSLYRRIGSEAVR